jgi:hypothetical protein
MITCLSISFYEKTGLHYVYEYNILKTFHTIDIMTPKFLLCYTHKHNVNQFSLCL